MPNQLGKPTDAVSKNTNRWPVPAKENDMQQLNLPTMTPVYSLKIERDEFPESPREWGNLGTMVCWHSRYRLGDKRTDTKSPEEYRLHLAENAEPGFEDRLNRAYDRTFSAASNAKDIHEWREAKIEAVLDKHYIILPLYLYDHSGITMNTSGFSCRWDSGQVGFIYVSRNDIAAQYGWKVLTAKRREQIARYLQGEVETYDQYLQGEVYGFVVEEQIDGQWEEIDSCWGFYGDDIDGVHNYVEQYGFTKDHIKEAYHYQNIGEWVTTEDAANY